MRPARTAPPLALFALLVGCAATGSGEGELAGPDAAVVEEALARGAVANEGLRRCRRFVDGWLAHADPTTGLIPRNLSRDAHLWNAQDCAADNYPFMVLTASLTDAALFDGRMRAMLDTERELTARLGRLPDRWSFESQAFADPEPDVGRILFGASEYVKDGLMPLTEWLGQSPWCDRMIELVDGIWEHADHDTPFGTVPTANIEVHGELLQVLSRLYWMEGEERYLEQALRLGDLYLLGDQHPTRDREVLRLRDHGCEIVSGLCELYATVHFARPDKKVAYRQPLHEMLDRILEVGRNEDGLFYDEVDPRDGTVVKERIADTWGYTLNGFYAVYLLDGIEAYREAVLRALSVLESKYPEHQWESKPADGLADTIESALNLLNREPVASAERWVDAQLRRMWALQGEDGVVEGWHGDGNFARTTILACLWKSRGATIAPWREDVLLGAVESGGVTTFVLRAGEPWSGRLLFDRPRHRTTLRMPFDWPRINQVPEWFAIDAGSRYELTIGQEVRVVSGEELDEGLPVELDGTAELVVAVRLVEG